MKYTPKVGDYFVSNGAGDPQDPIIILSEKNESGLFSISVGNHKESSHENFFTSQFRRRLSAQEVASITKEEEPQKEPVEKSLEDKQKEFDELLDHFEPLPEYKGPYSVTRSVYLGDKLNELTFTFDSKEEAWLYFEGLVHLHQAQELEGDDWLEITIYNVDCDSLVHFYRG